MSILIVTGIEGARNCAAVVQAQLGMEVEVADGRKAALAALRRREFLAVAVDETMASAIPPQPKPSGNAPASPSPADQLRPLRRSPAHPRDSLALHRRERSRCWPPRRHRGHRNRAQIHGCRPAASLAVGSQRSGYPLPVAERLRMVADLAGNLRQQLNAPLQVSGTAA